MLFNQQPRPEEPVPDVQETSIDKKFMEMGLESLYAQKEFVLNEIKSVEHGQYTIKNNAIPSISNSRYAQNLKREIAELQVVIDFKQQSHDDNHTQKQYLGGDKNFPITPEEEVLRIEPLSKKNLEDFGVSELDTLLAILIAERDEIERGGEEYLMNMKEYTQVSLVFEKKRIAQDHNAKITGGDGGGMWSGREGKRPLR